MTSRELPEQGEVWFANFDPVEGQEQAGLRPALVLSVNELNQTGLFMVIPGTSKLKRRPARIHVPAGHGGLDLDTWFLTDQLRTIDRRRLRRRLGMADRKYLLQALAQVKSFLRAPSD